MVGYSLADPDYAEEGSILIRLYYLGILQRTLLFSYVS